MSSIFEGYNYDVFISCRQKDNKHDSRNKTSPKYLFDFGFYEE